MWVKRGSERETGRAAKEKIHSEVMSLKDSINSSEVLIVAHIYTQRHTHRHTDTHTHTHRHTNNQ